MEALEFGEYLKQLRLDKKLTIRQLDLYSGVSNSYISQMERGGRGIPSPDILLKLSKPLGVDYSELMEKAGYLEGTDDIPNYTEMINEFLNTTLNQIGFDKKTLENTDLEEKIQLFFTATDEGTRIKVTEDSNGKKYFSIGKPTFDINEDSAVDLLNLEYDGIELTREEKEEFLALARGFFGARKSLKENN